ncbi:MAG: coenzyme F420-0:L-glutamate ligase [Thermoproteota archaeon]
MMRKTVKAGTFVAIPLRSKLWKPKTDFKQEIVKLISGIATTGDYVVLSEKALSTAMGLVCDESTIDSDPYSELMVFLTVRLLWGKMLGRLCRLSPETVKLLEDYPIIEGARHKKLVLRVGGPLQALKPTSEAGVDATNLPGHLVSLPLVKPFEVARAIREYISKKLGIHVNVVVVDTDKCYKVKKHVSLILACRMTRLPMLVNLGFISFLIARAFRRFFTPYATPIGFSPLGLDVDELLTVSELADRSRGFGAGRTLSEVEKAFGVKATQITWDLLDTIPHYPVVVIKRLKNRNIKVPWQPPRHL